MKIGVTQIILKNHSTEDIAELCRAAGYEIVELVFSDGGDPSFDIGVDELKALGERFAQAGVAVTSVLAHGKERGNFLSPDPAEHEVAHNNLVRAIEISSALGAGAVLLHPGQLGVDASYSGVWQSFREQMRRIAPVAQRRQVAVGIENVWNKFLLSPKEMRDFLDEVDSDWVGCYLDTANMMAYGYPEQWIDELGPRIKRVHFKDFKRKEHKFVPLCDGDTNWPRVMEKLRAIGYDAGVIHEVSGDRELQIEMARRMRSIVSGS